MINDSTVDSNSSPTSEELALTLDRELSSLHYDMQAIAWACEQLWHNQFRYKQDNEMLTRFPIAMLQMLAQRTGPLALYAEKLEGHFR